MLDQETVIVILFLVFLVGLGVIFFKVGQEKFDPLNNEYSEIDPRKWTENVPPGCDIYKSRESISTMDPLIDYKQKINRNGEEYEFESAIFDPQTQTLMTGSQFMDDTELVPPVWIYPAWDPNAPIMPSQKDGQIGYDDFENDSRMIYNKCSLACCGTQYPVPFDLTDDQCIADKNGENRYVSSEYTCMNESGNGCLCVTPKQASKLNKGF